MRKCVGAGSAVLFFCLLAVAAMLRFQNIDMTGPRFAVSFWPLYAALMLSALAAVMSLGKER